MRTPILLLLLCPLQTFAGDTDVDADCSADLKRLGAAVLAYRIVHDDKNPAQLSDLYYDGLVGSLGDFSCATAGAATASEIDAKSDYTLEASPGAENLLVRERVPRAGKNEVLAFFPDGTIKPVAGGASAPATGTVDAGSRGDHGAQGMAAPGKVGEQRDGSDGRADDRGGKALSREECEPADPAFEYDTNRWGGDLRHQMVEPRCPSVCAAACKAEPRCKAWTFVRAGHESEGCWLKDQVPPKSRNGCCVSGTVAPR